MNPISNIAYYIQYLTISFILDLQENIYKKVKKIHYMSGPSCQATPSCHVYHSLCHVAHGVSVWTRAARHSLNSA